MSVFEVDLLSAPTLFKCVLLGDLFFSRDLSYHIPKVVSEYDQDKPQSQTEDNPVANLVTAELPLILV